MADKPGVLTQERQRQEFWAARDLPDPIAVITEERLTSRQLGEPWRSPKRDVLDAYFADHPQYEPNSWKEK